MTKQTAQEVDDDAAGWAMRLGDGGAVPGLENWLAGDPRRSGALLRAQAALSLLDRARALEPAGALASTGISRRAWLALAGGGGLAAAGVAAVAVLGRGERYVTALGEIRRVPLKDGSVIDINTDTALAVAWNGRARDVVLEAGEAWFQVAKDARRPFMVSAGGARFRAVGTAFSVRRLGADHTEMLVTEGVVEAWRKDGRKVRVGAGQRLLLGPGLAGEAVDAPAQIERALAWRSGQISLEGLTLSEAAAEFNRYNRRRLIVENPHLAGRQFVGLFRVDEPQSFATAVAAASGAKLTQNEAEIRLR
jgi:transmembrane sensor